MGRARDILRSAAIWTGFAGVVAVAVPPMVFGYPLALVVNHQSFADLIATCFLDHPTKYLGKASVFDVPIFGWALRIAGEVPAVRGNRDSGCEALERLGVWLDRGVSVALFPEGTRTETGDIGAFKVGAFKLAIAHRRPVVPVVLSGARNLLPKGSLLFQGHADVRVHALDPVSTEGYTLDDAGKLAEEVRAVMVAAYP
jgi:1-acyl-sn-glycerol-3-phosphate acyltransferase